MPFVTVNIADRGTGIVASPKTGLPDVSATGHMWTTLQQDTTSTPISYGFAPAAAHESQPFAPGQVYINDNTNYTNNGQNTPYYSRRVEVTQAQFDAMKNFGESTRLAATDSSVSVKDVNGNDQSFTLHYNGLTNSCIDYSYKFMEVGGLNPSGYQGAVWPTWNKKFVDETLNQFEKNNVATPTPIAEPLGGSTSNLIDNNGHLTESIIKDANDNVVSSTSYDYSANGDTINVIYKNENGATIKTESVNTNVSTYVAVIDQKGLTSSGEIQYGQLISIAADGAVSVVISGTGAVANLDDATITLMAGTTATVSGSGNTVKLGSNDFLTSNGDKNNITVSGSSSTVYDNGTHDYVLLAGNGDTSVVAGANSITDSSGDGDTITLLGTNDGAGIFGNNSTATDSGVGGYVTLLGSNDRSTVSGVATVVTVASAGSGDMVMLAGINESAVVTGSSNIIFVQGTADTVTVQGTGQKTVVQGTDNTVFDFGTGDYNWLTGTGDSISVLGSSNTTAVLNTGNTANIGGFNNSTMVVSNNNTTAVTGNSNQTWIEGNSDTTSIQGSNQKTVIQGSNDVTSDQGTSDHNWLTGISDTINVNGNFNTTELMNTDNIANISGSNDVTVVTSNNNTTNITGNFDITSEYGNNDVANVSGANDTTWAQGNFDTTYQSGSNDVVHNFNASDRAFNSGIGDLYQNESTEGYYGGTDSSSGDAGGSGGTGSNTGNGNGNGNGNGSGSGSGSDGSGSGDTGDNGGGGGGGDYHPAVDDFGFAGKSHVVSAELAKCTGSVADRDLARGDTAGAAAASAGLHQAAAQAAIFAVTGGLKISVLEAAKWNKKIVTWSLASSNGAIGSSLSGALDSSYGATVKGSFQAWSKVTDITFKQVQDSTASNIRIGLSNFDTARTGVVGYTTHTAVQGYIASALVLVEDPNETMLIGANKGTATYAGTDAQFQQVLKHEIGHAIGFADDSDPHSIMFYELTSHNRGLNQTDRTGALTFYGTARPAPSAAIAMSLAQLTQSMASFSPAALEPMATWPVNEASLRFAPMAAAAR